MTDLLESYRQLAQSAVSELAANLMRICASGGDPSVVEEQACKVVQAFKDYRQAADLDKRQRLPPTDIKEALSVSISGRGDQAIPWVRHMETADITIISGALRVAAARLSGGGFAKAQESRGRQELDRGIQYEQEAINMRDGAREEIRAQSVRKLPKLREKPAK